MKRIKNILILTIVISTIIGQAQHYGYKPRKNHYKIGILPLIPVFASASFNYERDITNYTSIEISANFFIFNEPYHFPMYRPFYLTYRLYLPVNHKFFNKFWAGPYASYIFENETGNKGNYINSVGLGISFGRKNYFRNGRNFLDIGLGLSANYSVKTNKTRCSKRSYFPSYFPRVIFLFGKSN